MLGRVRTLASAIAATRTLAETPALLCIWIWTWRGFATIWRTCILSAGVKAAAAVRLAAEATADGVSAIAKAIASPNGKYAMQAKMATEYLAEMSAVLDNSKTVIVPNNPLDISGLIKQGMEVAKAD